VLLAVVGVAAYSTAHATTISMPYTFSNGTVADATEVNANFSTLVSESNAQNVRLTNVEADVLSVTAQASTNATNIASNAAAIASNASDISANASAIAGNASDIADNYMLIQSNHTLIQYNQTAISTNSSDIASNASDIATNASAIASNASDIATNVSAIASNASDIATNASDIADLQDSAHILGDEIAYQVNLYSYYFDQTGGCGGSCTVSESLEGITTNHPNTTLQDVRLHFDLPIPKYNTATADSFVITKVGVARGGSNRMWCRDIFEVSSTGTATSVQNACDQWYNRTPGYVEWDFPDVTTTTQNRYVFRFYVTTGPNDTELTNPVYGVTVFGKFE